MKKRNSSIDGFILKRSSKQLGDLRTDDKKDTTIGVFSSKPLITTGDDKISNLGQPRPGYGMNRFDVEESLSSIDSINEPTKKLSRRQRRRLEKQSFKRPRSLIRRIIKWLIILIILAAISFGGYMAYKFISASVSVFHGNILSVFNSQPLKQDSNGRSNFLILGTSEDDPGHDGADLTDSIMVVSVDQKNNNVFMFSVPRDLKVEYGRACIEGYRGLINSFFSCVSEGTTDADEQERLSTMQNLVGGIYGIDIQYGVHVNYTVLKDVVNAVGGSITVKIESDNPLGQMDSQLDWTCGDTYAKRVKNCPPNGHYVDYPNGKVVLDAQAALNLARARGDVEPTYGFANSALDRDKNQLKILVAIRDKALSNGILTNLGSITKLMDALGNNLRTNIQMSELQTLLKIASSVDSDNIHSLDMLTDQIINGTGNPVAGDFEYSQIQEYIAKNLSSNPVVHEAAPVVVWNGTDQMGLGQIEADKLTSAGFNVMPVENAPENTYTTTEIYQIGTGNNATASKLSDLFGVTIKKTMPPKPVNGNVRFVIIIGVATS